MERHTDAHVGDPCHDGGAKQHGGAQNGASRSYTKKRVPFSFYESIHDATTEGTVSEERERQQLERMLEQWIKHRSLPSDQNLRKLWQRLQTHVRNVAHMHRPPPQQESTLNNNMVEHPRHVAEQYKYRAIPTITSLPFRTLYLGGPVQPEDTGGCEAMGKEDSEGEHKKIKDVMTIKGGGNRWRTPVQGEIHIADDELARG